MPIYAVIKGREVGVFTDVDFCREQVQHYSRGEFRKFGTYKEAQDYILEHDYLYSDESYLCLEHTKPVLVEDLEDYDGPPSKFRSSHYWLYSPDIRVYTDGACRGNGMRKKGGAGYGVYYPEEQCPNALVPIKFNATNQRAELLAIRHALIDLANYLAEDPYYVANCFEIVTDSKYGMQAVNEFSEKWCSNGWKTSGGNPVKNQDLLREMVRCANYIGRCGVELTWTYVPGHSGDSGNDHADALANEGADILRYP